MATEPGQREHDVVVYGATGFVGKLTAAYLAENAPAEARIALGGRSPERLERTRAELGARAADWPLVVADSSDEDAVAALARSTRAVATTVGPYAKYGMPLLAACAAAGTNYADLTGEILFMRRAIDEHHETAKKSGARIVHTCGFDSIPSDLGVLALHEHARENDLGDLRETTNVLVSARGGLSGGTLDSLRGQIDEAKRDPSVRRVIGDPYALSPDRSAEPDLGRERDPLGVSHERELGGYMGPFMMAPLNTRVVRRSNALQDYAYGREFRYRELMRGGSLPLGPVIAGAVAGGLAAVYGGMTFGPTRKVLDRLFPDPGEGPSEKARERGYFKFAVHSFTSTGAHIVCDIKASGDPGYKATGVMLGEAALALALDGDKLPDAAGVLTPATAMGGVLTDRLRAAGQSYDVRAA